MVLDRSFQKPKPKQVAPPPQPKPKTRRDSAREPWEAQYDQVDEPEAAALEQDEDEEMNLATLLNVIDGNVENPGRIMIMTSNYPERLDKALVRKVRRRNAFTVKVFAGSVTQLVRVPGR